MGLIIIRSVAGYEFDVFISYSRIGSASKWMINNFYPKFQDCLADHAAVAPKVFLDKGMERGVEWPSRLQKALLHSKIMVAIFTPPYFRSHWCRAEMDSMLEREKLLGLATLDRPQGLVYPILYSDSRNFPPDVRRSWWDFKSLATPEPVFQTSPNWYLFHDAVSRLAEDLVELLEQVPEWQPDWPVVERPDPVLMPTPPIPRFGS